MVSESNGGLAPPQEMETFLPQNGSNNKEKIVAGTKQANGKDVESDEFDPFAGRNTEHATSDRETLTHLLKASLGSGILAMPRAFMKSGLALGIVFTVLVAVVCTHCAYVLIKCSHALYKRTRKTAMGFSEVSEAAFGTGPRWAQPYAYSSKLFIQICLFLTYFGTCSVYTLIVADSFKGVIPIYTGIQTPVQTYVAIMLIPLIMVAWIPNLKYLAPLSMVANVFMGVGLLITFYYIVTDLSYIKTENLAANWTSWPAFFSITIFAMEAIGVVMPLENAMQTPRNILGLCGVLNQGMSGVTLVYIMLGFLGYLRFGELTEDTITKNLDLTLIPSQVAMILIGLAVFCTFGLQFFVCIDIGWNMLKDKFTKRPRMAEYTMRTIMVILAVVVALVVPNIEALIGIIGSFCFSILGLFIPVVIEMITFWDLGFGKCYWVLWKNFFITIFAMLALVFGTMSAVDQIINTSMNGVSIATNKNSTGA